MGPERSVRVSGLIGYPDKCFARILGSGLGPGVNLLQVPVSC